jgi:hypothetical protein
MDAWREALSSRLTDLAISRAFVRVSEGTRTPDRLDHNQELYQLSYAHRGGSESSSGTGCAGRR